MANPRLASVAYGASTTCIPRMPTDDHEFRPSDNLPATTGSATLQEYRRVLYCDSVRVRRRCWSRIRVILHYRLTRTPAYPQRRQSFLLRYPTTATNRNRARSRWTYYHFLGLDVEKSASRTTDPGGARRHGTIRRCTTPPAPYATACSIRSQARIQNYGDEGLYRDQWGGLDSLDEFYKHNDIAVARTSIEVNAARDDPHIVTLGAWLRGGKERLRLTPRFDPPPTEDSEIWWHPGIDHVRLLNSAGGVVQHVELQDLDGESAEGLCGPDEQATDYYLAWSCPQEVLLEVPESGTYSVEVVLWFDHQHENVADQRRLLDVSLGGYVEGDTWYRDMRPPGFAGELVPDADTGLPWLAERIVEDERFAEAAVKFWWPAVMGGGRRGASVGRWRHRASKAACLRPTRSPRRSNDWRGVSAAGLAEAYRTT